MHVRPGIPRIQPLSHSKSMLVQIYRDATLTGQQSMPRLVMCASGLGGPTPTAAEGPFTRHTLPLGQSGQLGCQLQVSAELARPLPLHKGTLSPQVLDCYHTPRTLYPKLGLNQWDLALVHTVQVTSFVCLFLLAWVKEATLNPGCRTWPKVTWAWPILVGKARQLQMAHRRATRRRLNL